SSRGARVCVGRCLNLMPYTVRIAALRRPIRTTSTPGLTSLLPAAIPLILACFVARWTITPRAAHPLDRKSARIVPSAGSRRIPMNTCFKLIALVPVVLGLAVPVRAQEPIAPTAQAPTPPKTFTNDRMEQMAAPIALYPDALVAQILMASTYPIEVVEAA